MIELLKQTDRNLVQMKKSILSKEFKVDTDTKCILKMLKIELDELYAIASLVEEK